MYGDIYETNWSDQTAIISVPGHTAYCGCYNNGQLTTKTLLLGADRLTLTVQYNNGLVVMSFADMNMAFALALGAVAESIEHWSRVWDIVGSNPGQVKPMTYQIDTCRFLAQHY